MRELDEPLLRRWKGLRIVAISFAIGVVGIVPVLGYVIFGAETANPLGVGLLALLALGVATIGVLIGLIKLLMEAFSSGQY